MVWLTAVMFRRPWVGLPVTSRVHPWLGDRWVPSRRCAGGGSRPVCARSRVDCGSGRLPLLGRRVRVSWVVVTRCSSSCKYQSVTGGALPLRDPRRPCRGRRRPAVSRPASGRAERRPPLSAAKSLRSSCRRRAPLNGPGAGGVHCVSAVSGRRADLLPRSLGVVGSSCQCGPPSALESSGYPPAAAVSCIRVIH